jgi:hypothetical protein
MLLTFPLPLFCAGFTFSIILLFYELYCYQTPYKNKLLPIVAAATDIVTIAHVVPQLGLDFCLDSLDSLLLLSKPPIL